MNYLISSVILPKGVCALGAIGNVPNWAEMMAGSSQTGRFPTDAQFQMDSRRPKDVKLADVLRNMNRFFVVSERLKDLFMASDALKNNEVFEVGIVNHKGRREKAKYFLIHQIDRPKCVDEAQTVGVKSPLDPSVYSDLTKLAIDESKLDPDLAIFRPAEYKARVFFRRDIADKIVAAGMTGLELHEVNGYAEFL